MIIMNLSSFRHAAGVEWDLYHKIICEIFAMKILASFQFSLACGMAYLSQTGYLWIYHVTHLNYIKPICYDF